MDDAERHRLLTLVQGCERGIRRLEALKLSGRQLDLLEDLRATHADALARLQKGAPPDPQAAGR